MQRKDWFCRAILRKSSPEPTVRLRVKIDHWVMGRETEKCSPVRISVAFSHSLDVNHDKATARAWTHHSSVATKSHSMEDLGKGHTSVLGNDTVGLPCYAKRIHTIGSTDGIPAPLRPRTAFKFLPAAREAVASNVPERNRILSHCIESPSTVADFMWL